MWSSRLLSKAASVLSLLLLATIPGGCALIDTSLSPRSYTVNTGWDAYRNNAILLNIARASHAAPLHFVSLLKYTGNGEFGGGATTQISFAAADANPAHTFGPFNANAKSSNIIELATLDRTEFYQGMLAPVTSEELHWILRQGIPREVAFHVLLDTVRVTRPDGVAFDFRNDPLDDTYSGGDGRKCGDFDYVLPFGSEIWTGARERDCRYHKFLSFLQLGVRYGLTSEPILTDNPDHATDKTAPRQRRVWQLCYDAAVAREYGLPRAKESTSACGSGRLHTGSQAIQFRDLRTGRTVSLGKIEPVMRSPLGIFRYLGGLVSSGASERVVLTTREAVDPRTGDARLFSFAPAAGACFAEAEYLGERFCVPAQGAQNTKSIFSLLATLIALHVNRETLPEPSVIAIRP